LKTPEPGEWQRTSPFAILFFIGRTLRLIAKNAWQSLAPLFAVLVAAQGDIVSKTTLGIALFALAIGVAALLSYWFFRYQIGSDSVLIRQGVLKKTQLNIQFDRIQGINTRQNPVYRALGLVTVSFDTAGSASDEGSLPAVTRAFADSLREKISRKPDSVVEDADELEAPLQSLLTLNWKDMVRIGLADRRALIVFAVIGPLMEQAGDRIDDYVAEFVQRAAASGIEVDAASGISIGLAVAAALVLLFVIVSIAAAFLQYHNFELWLDGRTLRSRGGLLTRHEHSMDLEKIQTLRLQQGIVQGMQRRFHMTARQAVASGKQRNKKVFTIPSVTAEQADMLRREFLTPEAGALSQDPRSEGFTPVSRYYLRSPILFAGMIPALIMTIALWPPLAAFSLLFLLWPLPVAAIAFRRWRRAGFQMDENEIVRRSGFLGYRTVGLQFRKIQRITVLQSRFQRRKELATLRIYMASGSIRVPYIEHAAAKRLRDYILYTVESSRKAWH
jgi:putative membrane protein